MTNPTGFKPLDLQTLGGHLGIAPNDLKAIAQHRNLPLIDSNRAVLEAAATAYKQSGLPLTKFLAHHSASAKGDTAPPQPPYRSLRDTPNPSTPGLDAWLQGAQQQAAGGSEAMQRLTSALTQQQQVETALAQSRLKRQQRSVTLHLEGFINQYGAAWLHLNRLPLTDEAFQTKAHEFWQLVDEQPIMQSLLEHQQEAVRQAIEEQATLLAREVQDAWGAIAVVDVPSSTPVLPTAADPGRLLLSGTAN